ncbi:peptide chain release factor 2 [Candidatus Gracilibacteria bacterium]|nr:peptide chain release factor 2 [Candidatus Gracilibacteria bacterium]
MKKELLEQLHEHKEKWEALQHTLHLEDKKKELSDLQAQMQDPNFWNNQEKAQKVSQKASHLETFINLWEDIGSSIIDLPQLVEMASDTELTELQKEIDLLNTKFVQGEDELLLSGPYDARNAILSLHVGNGGQDAEDFTQILERMYIRFAEKRNWKIDILDESPTDSGLKSATIQISGVNAYGLLKSEHGVHRLIRLSPFNAKSLRQTSFARVEVLPETGDDTDIEIEDKDLRIDVFRSSGSGGQSVNTTDSAVRITYLPLNLIVTCQNEKSQLQNKQSAMKVLKSRLLQLKIEQQTEKIDQLRGEMMENSFGSQIRTYTLQPYKLVKDHRTDTEHPNPDKVFDGDIEAFIESYLRNKK